MSSYSGYVSARGDGVVRYITMVRDALGDTVAPFLERNTPHLMVSMGDFISNPDRLTNAITDKCRADLKTYSDGYALRYQRQLFLDSGGYQIQEGKVPPSKINELTRIYSDILASTQPARLNGFTVDVAPGKVCPFENVTQAYRLNYKTHSDAAHLPLPVRRKMFAIHHFRTPQLHKLFRRLLFEEGFAGEFGSFATGGLASKGVPRQCRCIAYVLPLIDVIDHAKQRGKHTVKFHVLGQADHKDHLTNLLLTEAVRRYHGINIELTCDSATYFNGWARFRDVKTIGAGDDAMKSLSFKTADRASSDCQRRFATAVASVLTQPHTDADMIERIVSVLSRDDGAYRYEVFGLLLYMHSHRVATDWSRAVVAQLIGLHQAGEKDEFVSVATDLLARLNINGATWAVKQRAERMYNSLSLVIRLDCDEARRIIRDFPEVEALTRHARIQQNTGRAHHSQRFQMSPNIVEDKSSENHLPATTLRVGSHDRRH